ncbi:MAG: HAD family acid phosphatase [Parvularcula sp.]
MLRTRLFAFGLFALLTACTTTDLKPSTAWVSEGTGWGEEAQSVYQEASDYITDAAAIHPKHHWAVVLDLDETVLNNVAYQVALERRGESYSSESWSAWTQEKRASLVPGAKPFIAKVNDLGGFVAFVTNRSDTDQLATEENLKALGLERGRDFRVLLTRARPDGPRNKSPRFSLVAPLLATQGYPDIEILAYVGDNKGDKPEDLGNARFFCIDQGAMYGDPCAAIPGPGQ